MRRFAKIVLIALAVLLLVAGITFWSLYSAATATLPEYEALLEVDPEVAEEQVNEFESQISALYSDTQSLEEWSSRVTAKQVNAWFDRRLDTDFPDHEETGIFEPRVMISPEGIMVAARSTVLSIDGILSIELEPFVTDESELAVRVKSAKLGRLELPLERIGEQMRNSKINESAPVRWTRGSGQLVVIVDPGRIDVGQGRRLRFVGIDLRDGELLLRGVVDRVENEVSQVDESFEIEIDPPVN